MTESIGPAWILLARGSAGGENLLGLLVIVGILLLIGVVAEKIGKEGIFGLIAWGWIIKFMIDAFGYVSKKLWSYDHNVHNVGILLVGGLFGFLLGRVLPAITSYKKVSKATEIISSLFGRLIRDTLPAGRLNDFSDANEGSE